MPKRSCFGLALLLRGDHGGALAEQERALAISPNLAIAHGEKGTTLVFSGQPEDGLASLRTSIRLDPRDAFSAIRLLHIGLPSTSAASTSTRPKRRSRPSDHPDFPLTYRWLTAALAQAGRVGEAREALEKAIAIAPASFDMYVRNCAPWMRVEDHAHILEGLRKAGWREE